VIDAGAVCLGIAMVWGMEVAASLPSPDVSRGRSETTLCAKTRLDGGHSAEAVRIVSRCGAVAEAAMKLGWPTVLKACSSAQKSRPLCSGVAGTTAPRLRQAAKYQ
jgi:hypothetical protein